MAKMARILHDHGIAAPIDTREAFDALGDPLVHVEDAITERCRCRGAEYAAIILQRGAAPR